MTGSSPSVIGVDLGGTKMALARFSKRSWEAEEEITLKTAEGQPFDVVFEDLVKAVKRLTINKTVSCGIGVPGLVAQPQGTVLTMPNIPGAEGFCLKKKLSARIDLPVSVENDANCFAYAEALVGAGKGQPVVVGVTLGTGVGGGIVINGNIFRGARGYAGEIGHMLLQPGNPPYETDDKRGDTEQFLSGTAIARRCPQAGVSGELLEGDVCIFLHPEIFREVAWMCANLTHLLDPSIIVFGGSTGRALKNHLPRIGAELAQWLLPKTPAPALAVSSLRNSAVLGAALLAG